MTGADAELLPIIAGEGETFLCAVCRAAFPYECLAKACAAQDEARLPQGPGVAA